LQEQINESILFKISLYLRKDKKKIISFSLFLITLIILIGYNQDTISDDINNKNVKIPIEVKKENNIRKSNYWTNIDPIECFYKI